MLPMDLSLRRKILTNIKEISTSELDQYEHLVALQFFLDQFSRGKYFNEKKVIKLKKEIDLVLKNNTQKIKKNSENIQKLQNLNMTQRAESLITRLKRLNPKRDKFKIIFKTPTKFKYIQDEYPDLFKKKIKPTTRLKNFYLRNV